MLEDILRTEFIPNLTGRPPPNDVERKLLALPARLGGFGISDHSLNSDDAFKASLLVTAPLRKLIQAQNPEYTYHAHADQMTARADRQRNHREQTTTDANSLRGELTPTLQKAMDIARERGSSSWLTSLPLEEHGFVLHKGAFVDALALRYGWALSRTPSSCECGASFTVEHVLSCPRGGFPSIRHNEIRDITANLLTEVCRDVQVVASRSHAFRRRISQKLSFTRCRLHPETQSLSHIRNTKDTPTIKSLQLRQPTGRRDATKTPTYIDFLSKPYIFLSWSVPFSSPAFNYYAQCARRGGGRRPAWETMRAYARRDARRRRKALGTATRARADATLKCLHYQHRSAVFGLSLNIQIQVYPFQFKIQFYALPFASYIQRKLNLRVTSRMRRTRPPLRHYVITITSSRRPNGRLERPTAPFQLYVGPTQDGTWP